MPDINIVLKGTDQASPALKKVEKEVKDLGTTAKTASGPSGLGGLQNVLKAGLTTAVVGVAGVVGGLAFAFKDSIGEARESIETQKQLAAVLTSTGYAAGISVDAANALAGSLAQVTNFGDDTILAGENMLLTFTNIGKDVFPRATETMLDMSQALGQDLQSSAVQLGKALNDPIAGVSALSRVGVTFTEQQKDVIKAMVETGDTAGAQALILDELSREFGGSAKALADPLVQLSNAWGEIQETVGMFIVPLLGNLAKQVLPLVQGATEALGGALTVFYGKLDEGASPLSAITAAIRSMLPEDMQPKFDKLTGDIAGTFNTIVGTVQTTMGWVKLAWDTNWGDVRKTWEDFATELPRKQEEFWKEWNRVFGGASTQNANDWEGFVSGLFGITTRYLTLIVTNWTLTLGIFRSSLTAFSALFSGDWETMWNATYTFWTSLMNQYLGFIDVFFPNFRTKLIGAFTGPLNSIKEAWQGFVNWWNSTVGAIPGVPSFGGSSSSMPSYNAPSLTPGNWPKSASAAAGQINNINVNMAGGGYENGFAAGEGIVDAMRFRGH